MTTKPLAVHPTPILGLLVIDLPVHGDARGWFKENWQREKMVAEGLPDFQPVQNNISCNEAVGVTRGIHAEPWDKFISVASGVVFGVWVDLREGPTFGATYYQEIRPDVAVFVPRGVGNAFQTLEAPAVYTYLVNDHWSEQAQSQYTFLNLADETVAIPWPIPLNQAELSARDREHPRLAEVTPMSTDVSRSSSSKSPAVVTSRDSAPTHAVSSTSTGATQRRTLIVGAGGQLGRALSQLWAGRSDVDAVDRETLDIADASSVAAFDFAPYGTIVNAAAYTAVDRAESQAGRREAWATNADGTARLVEAARRHGARLVHVSTDYVFDGAQEAYTEEEAFSPLSVYGQSKAAGDRIAETLPEHFIIRTSWVVGDGSNFVRTMAALAERGVDPSVVSDQRGRLSFAADIAAAIDHLLRTDAAWGTYNISCAGEPWSWAEVAARVFELSGHDPRRITPVTTEEYYAGQGRREGDGEVAPRPRNSTLDLTKAQAAGVRLRDQGEAVEAYLRGL